MDGKLRVGRLDVVMRLVFTGLAGPLAPRIRDRLMDLDEMVQVNGDSPPGVARAAADLHDVVALRQAMDGAQVLVHDALGAWDELAPGDRGPEGLLHATAAVLEAAHQARVRRIVYLSTSRAEAAPSTGRWPALDALRGAEARARRWAVVLAPAALVGPGLEPSAALGRALQAQARSPLPGQRRRVAIADVRDAAAAGEAALVRGTRGQRYPLSSSAFWLGTWDRAARARPVDAGPPPPPDLDCPFGCADAWPDPSQSASDLGFWTRRPGRTLADALDALSARPRRA